MTADTRPSGPQAPDPAATLRSRGFLMLLPLAAVIGVLVSAAAWGFLELVHQIQVGVFHDDTPLWLYFPILLVAGILAALAIKRLPGHGGHVPADGLHMGATEPRWIPGVTLAALATIGLGVVLGPEAPLIALGSGLALFAIRRVRHEPQQQVEAVVAATGSFAALSMIFDSPLVAAVFLIEAAGLGGATLPLILLPGLLGAGIGSLISIGMGSWTGLDTSAYSIGALTLPHFSRPELSDFGWTILLGIVVALAAAGIMTSARRLHRVIDARLYLLLPLAGLAIAGLAVVFEKTTDKGANQVLFSGQDALGPLVSNYGTWSLSALALLIVLKGMAWCVALAGFRGGPTFPALFLGAAGGVMASHLPGFALTPAVAVGMSAAVAAVLRLPLSAIVLGALLTAGAGAGAQPLMIVGVVVAYLVTLALDAWIVPQPASR